jgi:hypothetical protein
MATTQSRYSKKAGFWIARDMLSATSQSCRSMPLSVPPRKPRVVVVAVSMAQILDQGCGSLRDDQV